MTQTLSHLKPTILWNHFERLCAIPHPSKHEQQLGKYLADFGHSHKLETIVDDVGNVIIRKPATPGMEKRKTVCLQAHMDMVPQKNANTAHDFLKDPIKPRIEGDAVFATGTTLGADNGIGVAAILSVLESKDIQHGPIEALITIDEEAGMTGAKGLKPGLLKAEYMINLDSEDENEICVGCAGGIDSTLSLPAPREALPGSFTGFEIKVSGLRGGHSGVDITLGRANAHLLIARMLFEALADFDVRLSHFEGGDLRNVIPRESRVVVAVEKNKADAFTKRIQSEAAAIKKEFAEADPEIKIDVHACTTPKDAIRAVEGKRIISTFFSCPNGVAFMTLGMPDLAETSSNFAAVKTEANRVTVISLQRSSQDTRKVELAHRIRSIFELAGGEGVHSNPYSGWNPNMKSPLLHLTARIYEETYGRKPEIKATHGGLECGIIMGAYPQLQAVSIGPTIKFPHSPDEHVMIAPVARFWDYLLKVLREMPV